VNGKKAKMLRRLTGFSHAWPTVQTDYRRATFWNPMVVAGTDRPNRREYQNAKKAYRPNPNGNNLEHEERTR
jgi:hypothetical protein